MFHLTPWKKTQIDVKPGTTSSVTFDSGVAQFRNEFNSLIDRFIDDCAVNEPHRQRFTRYSRASVGRPGFIHSAKVNRSSDFGSQFESFGWGIDLEESQSEYLVRAEAPGFQTGDFNVQVRGNHLLLAAEHKDEQKNGDTGSSYHYGRFERSVPLPEGAKAEDITARYHNGVLEVRLPKGEEARGRQITVESI